MKRWSLDNVLGLLALLTFAATRLIGLAQYPIYFFTDEAVNTVLAAEFLDNGFRDQFGQLFPHVLSERPIIQPEHQRLRASCAVSAVRQIDLRHARSACPDRFDGRAGRWPDLEHIFKSRLWWTSILLLSLTPAWFLHTRTAFEHTLWVSFFAWFLYFYLRYRTDQPKPPHHGDRIRRTVVLLVQRRTTRHRDHGLAAAHRRLALSPAAAPHRVDRVGRGDHLRPALRALSDHARR